MTAGVGAGGGLQSISKGQWAQRSRAYRRCTVTCRAHPEHCAQTQHEGFLQPKRSPGERKTQTKGQEPMAAVGGMRTQRMQAYITRSGQTAAPRSRGQPSPATPDLLATEQAAAQSQHVPAALREHTHTAPGCAEQELLAGREQLDFLKDNNPFKHSASWETQHSSQQAEPAPSLRGTKVPGQRGWRNHSLL